MKKIRVKMGGRKRSGLGEVGSPAQMVYQNFETLMGLKPDLELLGADPHDPAGMNNSNTPEKITLSEDPNRPSAEEIASGTEFEGDKNPEAEKVPHEHEKVRQSNDNLKDAAFNSKEEAMRAQEEFKMKYRLAQKLARVKVAANLIQEVDEDMFVDRTVDEFSLNEIERSLEDHMQMYDAMKSSQKTASTSTPPIIPNFKGGGPSSPAVDPLTAIMSGV